MNGMVEPQAGSAAGREPAGGGRPLPEVINLRYDAGDARQPRSINFYFDHYRGRPISRVVVYLANRGCEWSRRTGGCTMCGTKNTALRRPIADADFLAQFDLVRQEVERFQVSHSERVRTIHVYNDGLFFNDDEIGPAARDRLYDLVRAFGFEKLVVETNGFDVMRDARGPDHLGHAVRRLAPAEFEVTLGVESADPLVRALYRKPDSLEEMRAALATIRRQGAIAKGYLLVKGPLLSEAEAFADTVQTIRQLLAWSGGERIRLELQPTCLLPNTLHEFLMQLPPDDPYRWEPPLMSTLLRILHEFPAAGEDLYTALFARIDQDSSWDFWLTRPHDDPATTFPMYRRLVEHYLHRDFGAIEAGLALADASLWRARQARVLPHPLAERVEVIHRMLELARCNELSICNYLQRHLVLAGDFIESCKQHIRQVESAGGR